VLNRLLLNLTGGMLLVIGVTTNMRGDNVS
jgi:hypothetical protein